MENSGFLKTVSFGGFDKKDVLNYVDELNTKIITLENEIKDKNELLNGKEIIVASDNGDNSELIEKLNSEKSKSAELMANIQTLKLEIESQNSVVEERNQKIKDLESKVEELQEKLASSKSTIDSDASFDIGSVFIEAKHSADRIISEAKNAARKMDDDAKNLAEQIVSDANTKAQGIAEKAVAQLNEANIKADTIVSMANSKANEIISNAEIQSSTILSKVASIKETVKNDLDTISKKYEEAIGFINSFASNSIEKIQLSKSAVNSAYKIIQGDNFSQVVDNENAKKNSEIKENSVEKTPVIEEIIETPIEEFNEDESISELLQQVESSLDNINEDTATNEGKVTANPSDFGIDLEALSQLTAEIEQQITEEQDTWDESIDPSSIVISEL